jgi:hypothetical protein
MKKTFVTLVCALACLSVQGASAAIKFKRFPDCAGGPVTEKTCECRVAATPTTPASRRFHYCHAGESCDSTTSKCSK